MKRKRVYMAHPLRGATIEETQANRRAASALVAAAVVESERRGEPISPVCAWIHLAECWSEAEGRELGLIIDCDLIELCDELWLLGPLKLLSDGMVTEMIHASGCGLVVRDMRK